MKNPPDRFFKNCKVLLRITLVLTYIQVIFEGSHPTIKLTKQKNVRNYTSQCSIFFYFAEIQKMTKLGPENQFWDLNIKIHMSGSHPTLNPLFFEIQT